MKILGLRLLIFVLISSLALTAQSFEHCRYVFNTEIIASARRLHTTWQETTKHPTRYRLVEDESHQTYSTADSYFQRSGIPQNLKKYYRLNRHQQLEEDIRQIPYDFLSYGNRVFSLKNAESIDEQVQWLLSLRLKTSEEARHVISASLQTIHSHFLQYSSRRYQRSPNLELLSSDLRISNVLPLAREVSRQRDPQNFFHLLLEKALEEYVSSIRTDQFLPYTELPITIAYYRILSDRGQRLPIDDLTRQYFTLAMPPVTHEPLPDHSSGDGAAKTFIADHLKEKILSRFPGTNHFTLVKPDTFTGSYALVYMIHNEKNEPIGAIKVQSDRNRGLEEVLSSLAATEFIRVSNKDVQLAGAVDFGRLTENQFFIIFESAKTNDLDWWSTPRNATSLERNRALRGAAEAVAKLHFNPEKVTVESIATFKANALYDVREALGYLETKNLEGHLKHGRLNRQTLHRIRNLIAAATKTYDRNLEYNIESFRPGIIHGDLHGGNIFFNPRTGQASFIDFGDLTWFIGKNRQATGDPSNDLGRFLAHLLVYEIRAGRSSKQSFEITKTFYHDYLQFRGITKGSEEEKALHAGTIFYMHRYFTKQASDLTGRKFNSTALSQQALFARFFQMWQVLPKALP